MFIAILSNVNGLDAECHNSEQEAFRWILNELKEVYEDCYGEELTDLIPDEGQTLTYHDINRVTAYLTENFDIIDWNVKPV